PYPYFYSRVIRESITYFFLTISRKVTNYISWLDSFLYLFYSILVKETPMLFVWSPRYIIKSFLVIIIAEKLMLLFFGYASYFFTFNVFVEVFACVINSLVA